MCDFKPGDEVVLAVQGRWIALDRRWWQFWKSRHFDMLNKGQVYVVDGTALFKDTGEPAICLVGVRRAGHTRTWFSAKAFRKVQRRDLTAWLATENTIEGPVRPRVPA